MFYFTCNESKIYESFTFWNNLQEKNELFHNILIHWDAPVFLKINSECTLCHVTSKDMMEKKIFVDGVSVI